MAEETLEQRLAKLYAKRDFVDRFNEEDVKTLIDAIRDAREHGGTASVDITPLSGGGGYTITITDSEGTEHTATVKDGGDAYSVYESTVPDGQTPMSKAEWLASLKGDTGNDGSDGHNPCLGVFADLTSLQNAHSTAEVGDYAYVDVTDSTTQTTTKHIFRYSGSAWVDNGEGSPDKQTAFDGGTGPTVAGTKIDDTELANPASNALAKATDVMQLLAKLEGVDAKQTKIALGSEQEKAINGNNGELCTDAYGGHYTVNLNSDTKNVRFLATEVSNQSTYPYGYCFYSDNEGTIAIKSELYRIKTGSNNQPYELVVEVPDNAVVFKFSVESASRNNVYCYLQSGKSVKDMIPAPFEIESVGEYMSSKKIGSTGVVSSSTTFANLVLKVDVTGRDGETLLLSGTCFATSGGNSYAWWSFKGANNEQLDVSGMVTIRTNYERVPVTVPTGAVTLYVIGTTQARDVLPRVEYLAGVSGDTVRAVITDATPLVGEVSKDKLDSAGQVQSTSSTNNRLMKIDVSGCVGKTLELTGVIIANSFSTVTYSWWAIHDENDNVLSHSGEYSMVRATMTDVRVVVPTGAKWLYVFGSNKETSDKEPQAKLLGELRQTAIEEAEKVYGEKELKVLCFGNSYTLDSFQYLPFILKSMYPKLKLTLGIGYIGACPIVQHVVNLDSQSRTCLGTTYTPTNYTYYKYTGFGSISNGVAYTAEKMLADEKWDLIVTQQSSEHSWEDYDVTYDPYINDFCRLLSGMVGYNFKLGFVLTHSSRTATKAELVSRYETVVANTREVMETMPFDVIFPYGTAIQSCRTNDDLYSIYGTTAMCGDSPKPVHLCDGFPCLVANYTNALALLNMLGLSSVGIVGEQTRPNLTWCNNHGIQGMNYPNGATLEVTDRLAYYAQMAAINAVKRPYEVTDMSGYDVEEPQEEA